MARISLWTGAATGPAKKVAHRRGGTLASPDSDAGVMILGSSVVERSAVNRLVVGSNPTPGARVVAPMTLELPRIADPANIAPIN